jgi:hypothetical protein
MEPMTPEEQFTKVWNALNYTAELQARLAENEARHDEEIAELRAAQKIMTLALAKLAEEQRSGAREIREVQRITGEKLNLLIETVDRIIRERGGKN